MLLILVAAAAYWVWFGLTNRSIFQDEGISILAARGIADHGYPLLPSGFVYVRGYIPNYMVGGVLWLLGDNHLSVMLPSLVMALGSLWVTYLYARDVFRKPWVGVVAVVLLLAFQMQTLYATGPRMYMALQFFTLLASYAAWRGFALGEFKYKVLAFLAAAVAMLSHQQGVSLIVALPLAIMAVALAKLPDRQFALSYLRYVASPVVVVGSVVVVGIAIFVTAYDVPGATPAVTADLYSASGILGLNLNPFSSDGGVELKRALLYGVGFAPLGLAIIVAAVTRRRTLFGPAMLFSLAIVTGGAVVTFVGTAQPFARMWFFLMPLYGVMAADVAISMSDPLRRRASAWMSKAAPGRVGVAAAMIVVLGIALGVGPIAYGFSLSELTAGIVGPPCQSDRCDRSVRDHHEYIADYIGAADVVISSNPFVTHFYLGRVDGYLREKVTANPRFADTPDRRMIDEYFGIPLVDAEDLREMLADETRVWVIADERVQWISSSETRAVLATEYEAYHADDLVTTFVNAAAAGHLRDRIGESSGTAPSAQLSRGEGNK